MRYYVFFTNHDGTEEMGGSHYDLDRLCETVELFIRINKERDFKYVAVCAKEGGELKEIVRWQKGIDVPFKDLR